MFLGCCICGKMTEISKKDKKYIIESEEFTCSPTCIRVWISREKCKVYSQREYGQRLCNNYTYPGHSKSIQYRSVYEEKVAFFLSNNCQCTFGYETFGFNLSVGTYTPDFWIGQNAFIEIKGIIGIGFKTKLKRLRKEYPDVKLLFIPWILKDYFYEMPVGGVIR